MKHVKTQGSQFHYLVTLLSVSVFDVLPVLCISCLTQGQCPCILQLTHIHTLNIFFTAHIHKRHLLHNTSLQEGGPAPDA